MNFHAQQQNTKKDKNKQESKIKKEKQKDKEKEKSETNKKEDKKIEKDQKKEDKRIKKDKKIEKKKPFDFSSFTSKKKVKHVDTQHNQLQIQKFKKHTHKPFSHTNLTQKFHYVNPIQYHYTISPQYIYRGVWIRYYFLHDNGFFFYDGYPYFVYNNYFHRYSDVDTGAYELVDSITDKVYAVFYGANLKQSYDRCADLRDRLNNEEGFYRYFCAERFVYDSDYYYDWDPDDYPDWYWY